MKWSNAFWILALLALLLIGATAMLYLPTLLLKPAIIGKFDVAYDQQHANAATVVNGIAGPIISFIAVILTALVFFMAVKNSNEQAKDREIDRFEGRFFELLRMHRANVEEMSIGGVVRGRKCVVRMFDEFRALHHLVFNHHAARIAPNAIDLSTKMTISKLAYGMFYQGVNNDSDYVYAHLLEGRLINSVSFLKKYIENLQTNFERSWRASIRSDSPRNISLIPDPAGKSFSFDCYYYPFDGHTNRLGHYYRHLSQTVKFVLESPALETKEQRKSYLRTLRAQLSNYEQLLLYYNAMAWFPQEWNTAFTEYHFIKNLPLDLADFGVTPYEHFGINKDNPDPKHIAMFEDLEKRFGKQKTSV